MHTRGMALLKQSKFDFHAKIWAVEQLNVSLWLGRLATTFFALDVKYNICIVFGEPTGLINLVLLAFMERLYLKQYFVTYSYVRLSIFVHG